MTETFFFYKPYHAFQSVMFIEFGQNVNKWYLIDEAILGKMGVVYVTYVADADKG